MLLVDDFIGKLETSKVHKFVAFFFKKMVNFMNWEKNFYYSMKDGEKIMTFLFRKEISVWVFLYPKTAKLIII